jgi:hypothetical protein
LLPGPQAASKVDRARIAMIGTRLIAFPFGLEQLAGPRQETEVSLSVPVYP